MKDSKHGELAQTRSTDARGTVRDAIDDLRRQEEIGGNRSPMDFECGAEHCSRRKS
jgi:hypothetical protein